MPGHSAIVGGSNADRLINCPASYQETLKVPKDAIKTSEYADEGTALHAAINKVFVDRVKPEDLVGEHFHDRFLDHDHVRALDDAMHYVMQLLDQLGAKKFQIQAQEESIEIPGIPGAHGTMDLLLTTDNRWTIILDWKFGSGVNVEAFKTDIFDQMIPNGQACYYGVGARAKYPMLFGKGQRIAVAIVQPRVDEDQRLQWCEISNDVLSDFHKTLVNAVQHALGRNPHMQRGDWCRFAPCKAVCPKWTGPLLDLTALGKAPAVTQKDVENRQVSVYGEHLGKALDFIALIEPLIREFEKQAHDFLEAGGLVPGYKLVPKRAYRQWIDEMETIAAMKALKYSDEQIHEHALKSPAQMEKLLPRGHKLPDGLVHKVSSGNTVAPEGDPRPGVTTAVRLNEFRESLKALAGAQSK